MATMSEDRLGNYTILRSIYPGVTSIVLEAQDGSGRKFAIKQLLESRSQDSAARRAFEYEAKLGLSLHHPNIIKTIEYVKDPDQPYVVMEYFTGQHLKLAISKPNDYPHVRRNLHKIITQAAKGLAYMHDQGWIHRDIKPENIMVNRSIETRIIDFTLTQRPVSGLSALFKKKMKARQGTPSYMSPEQIHLATPTMASDVYSFGITCYELGCGRPPFRANSTSELLGKQVKEQPVPLSMHNKDVTPEFNDLIMAMIKKNPAERPQDMHEFLNRFSRIRVFKDDPPLAANRDGF
jgi:serine/threonine protein kinase